MATGSTVDNAFYDTLGESWYDGANVAMAILKRESEFKNPWIQSHIEKCLGSQPLMALDLGCGGGFVSNYLARCGHHVLGLDSSMNSLRVAARHGGPEAPAYAQGDACRLPVASESVSVISAMDLLEHIETPELLVAEAARVLKRGGLFFFQTYNRSPLAWLMFVWGVNRTPGAVPNTHVYRLFIKPAELRRSCEANGMRIEALTGFRLAFNKAAWNALRGRFDEIDGFQYEFDSSLAGGYMGYARKAS